MNDEPVKYVDIIRMEGHKTSQHMSDSVAVQEPLEISVAYHSTHGRQEKKISITMRTPGNDAELAAGFLFTEGIIHNPTAIKEIKPSADENKIVVELQDGILPALPALERNFYTTSSCGVCGKSSLEAIKTVSVFKGMENDFSIPASILYNLEKHVKERQAVFANTGGIHASVFLNQLGELVLLKEDVGRHNALDKLIGQALIQYMLPLNHGILFLSGRASFELIQKAVMAGIRFIVAVGAPSSLAVELAKENDITLIGFLRNERFNVYHGEHRIILSTSQ